jgi:hypothetical protein
LDKNDDKAEFFALLYAVASEYGAAAREPELSPSAGDDQRTCGAMIVFQRA